MILALDVGNTNIVVGGMEGTEIKFLSRFSSDKVKTYTEYAIALEGFFRFSGIDPKGFSGVVMSSVVPPLTATLKRAVEQITGVSPLIVGAGIKTGVNIRIDDPAETGSDLVAAAAGAIKLYKPPVIIIDMGTATTITVLDKTGSLIGGAIVPGVGLSLDALTTRTSLLPRIQLEAPKKVISTNTVDCMKSGSILGAAAMLDGMIDRMSAELGCDDVTIVATGGIAPAVVANCRHEIILNDDLLLQGLAVIYEKNQKN